MIEDLLTWAVQHDYLELHGERDRYGRVPLLGSFGFCGEHEFRSRRQREVRMNDLIEKTTI